MSESIFDKESLLEIFEKLDVNGDGKIDFEEFSKFFYEEPDIKPGPPETSPPFSSFENPDTFSKIAGNDRKIDFNEFLGYMKAVYPDKDEQSLYQLARQKYDSFDSSNDGQIEELAKDRIIEYHKYVNQTYGNILMLPIDVAENL